MLDWQIADYISPARLVAYLHFSIGYQGVGRHSPTTVSSSIPMALVTCPTGHNEGMAGHNGPHHASKRPVRINDRVSQPGRDIATTLIADDRGRPVTRMGEVSMKHVERAFRRWRVGFKVEAQASVRLACRATPRPCICLLAPTKIIIIIYHKAVVCYDMKPL